MISDAESSHGGRDEGRWWAPILLALLVASGALKASPVLDWLPVDLTLAVVVALAITMAYEALKDMRAPWLPIAVVAVVVGLGYSRGPLTTYGEAKTLALALLTFGCGVIGGALLLRTASRRWHFLIATLAVGTLVALLSHYAPGVSAASTGRVSSEGATTIATGRLTGAALVVVVALTAMRRLRWTYALPLLAALGFVGLTTGSRGPLVAAVIASFVMAALLLARHPLRTIVIAGLVAVLARVGWQWVPIESRSRVALLWASDTGASVSEREYMWGVSWRSIQTDPLGLGWGNLAPKLTDKYPHNILLEVGAEAGVVAAAMLVALIALAAWRAWGVRHDPVVVALVGLLVFWLVNALVSGDVNDNRGLFILLAACWSLRSGSKPLGLREREKRAASRDDDIAGTRGTAVDNVRLVEGATHKARSPEKEHSR